MMQNIYKFLMLRLIAVAALFTTGMMSTASLQQAYAASNNCHDNVVGVCANVCANVNVIGKQNSNRLTTIAPMQSYLDRDFLSQDTNLINSFSIFLIGSYLDFIVGIITIILHFSC